MPLRLAVMGTGAFGQPMLKQLLQSPHAVAALVTQPDRTGPGHHRHLNPMKVLAAEHGVTVLQPAKASAADFIAQLQELGVELLVVAAYGQILSSRLLAAPRLGAVNLHASLLPRYRGAAPIHKAIAEGETVTGVTVFQIVPELDAGPLLGMVSCDIQPGETSGSLHDRLAILGGDLMRDVVDRLAAGTATAVPQDHALATFAPKMTKDTGAIDWQRPAVAISNHVRAMTPWPSAYAWLIDEGQPPLRLTFQQVEPWPAEGKSAESGAILVHGRDEWQVRAADGWLRVTSIQPAGKRVMSVREFQNGRTLTPAARLAPHPPS